jgi:hypothetical protein
LGFVAFLQFSPRSSELEGALLADTNSFHAPLPQVTPIRNPSEPYDPAKKNLDVPPGKAQNLPSIRFEETFAQRKKAPNMEAPVTKSTWEALPCLTLLV